MKNKSIFAFTGATLLAAFAAAAQSASAQPATKGRSTIAQSLTAPALPLSRVQEGDIPFPLPKDSQAYSSIDGKKMHKYVVELAQISRRYRDAGHPKFWGRIMGTPSDVETNEWLATKFKSIGLMDVRTQPIDLPPQWMPKSWDVTMTSGGQTIHVDSAQPDYGDDGLPAGGVEVDAVYAGLGTEADFAGKDVRGKSVFVYSMLGLADQHGVQRASEKGAAVVFEVSMLPGNMRYQAYPSGAKVPSFTVGNDDGTAVRQMIEAARDGAAPKIKMSLDVEKIFE